MNGNALGMFCRAVFQAEDLLRTKVLKPSLVFSKSVCLEPSELGENSKEFGENIPARPFKCF